MHTVIFTKSGKADLVQSLSDASELLCDLAAHLKTLAHSGVILSSDAIFAEEISKDFEELSESVLSWISRKQGAQNIGER